LLLEIPKLLLFKPAFYNRIKYITNVSFAFQKVITRLDEPQPLKKGVRALPSMGKHCKFPQSLVIEATKIKITA